MNELQAPVTPRKFACTKGHIHSTEQQAAGCYICKRRARRRDGKRSEKNSGMSPV